MGLFDIFKKKDKNKEQVKDNSLSAKKNEIKVSNKSLTVHPNVINLLWIKNGPMKNYDSETNKRSYENEFITITMMDRVEPSLIDVGLPIKIVKNISSISGPSYYPSYDSLTPEQRYIYWSYLADPFNSQYDISYVFILYYGLERHLFKKDIEQASKLIIELRKVHKNNSFQYYSSNAVVLSCLVHQRADIMQMFLSSLENKDNNLTPELFLLALHSFELPLHPQDMMTLSKSFGFKKQNYIKDYPHIFESNLREVLLKEFNKPFILLKDFVADIESLNKKEMSLFANMNLMDETVEVQNLFTSDKLVSFVWEALNSAHEKVKIELAKMRKQGAIPTKNNTKTKKKKPLEFDYKKEAELLDELKKNQNNPIDRHFVYNSLIDFYYKYRDLSEDYLNKSIEYSEKDISALDELQKMYIAEETQALKKLQGYDDSRDYSAEIKRVHEDGFPGRIPAFTRLIIIYDKKKEYDKAIEIANEAIKYYSKTSVSTDEFYKRIEKLERKKSKL